MEKRKYLMKERLPSGAFRYRFRDPYNRSKLTFRSDYGTPDFEQEYADFVENMGGPRPAEVVRVQALKDTTRRVEFYKKSLRRIQSRARAMGREFDLVLDDLLEMDAAQFGRCVISNVKLQYSSGEDGTRNPFAPSVDRVDSRRGYVKDNVQITCLILNIARADFEVHDFIAACGAVARSVRA